MESKHIVNVKIYGAYHIGHQQLTRIKVNVTVSHGLETIDQLGSCFIKPRLGFFPFPSLLTIFSVYWVNQYFSLSLLSFSL